DEIDRVGSGRIERLQVKSQGVKNSKITRPLERNFPTITTNGHNIGKITSELLLHDPTERKPQNFILLVDPMATQTRILNQDYGFGFPLSGKVMPKKIEGNKKPRRPLQELNCKNLENLPSNKALDIVAPKKTAKPEKPNQDKVKKNGGRRALGDLTNSTKLIQRDVLSSKNSSLKLPSVAENGLVVAEEGSLHDHGECIKAQRCASAMDVDYFLETVGFPKDCSTPIMSMKLPLSASKIESLMRLEFNCYGTLSPTASPKLQSPVRHIDHDIEIPQLGIEWDALDFCGFKMESPSNWVGV
ncbi:hypothetical protein V2J09_016366, partial [Rumex salicifolius]